MNQPQLGNLESIAIAAIRPSTTNPRKHFDDAALNELRDSIQAMGVTQPILVRYLLEEDVEEPEIYELVSGERRWRAARAADLSEIPAFVRELTDAEALEIQMVENLQRQDLHPMEEAEGYRVLIVVGLSAEDVAKKAGKMLGYVQQRLKLLTLEVDARQLFLDKHLTLGHALLLARLTPADQERAVMFLVGLRDWEMKKELSFSENVAKHIAPTKYTWMHGEDRAKSEAKANAERLVKPTEAELVIWIRDNVLLVLKGVPWDLGDAELLPVAGACTTCPKRTGASAALFADITTVEDTCTDRVCFADKQRAFVAYTQQQATETGSPLLKLTVKRGVEKLPAPVVELKPGPLAAGKSGQKTTPTVKAVVVVKKAVKEGQWMEAKRGECPMTVQAIYTDGPKTGQTRYVCADQDCKVHKHQVETPRPASSSTSGSSAKPASPEEQKFRAAMTEWETEKDRVALVAVLRAVSEAGKLDRVDLLRTVAKEDLDNWSWEIDVVAIARAFDLPIAKSGAMANNAATAAVEKFIGKASEAHLWSLSWMLRNREELNDDPLDVGKKAGLPNPTALIKQAEAEFTRTHPEPVKPEAPKPAAKKAAPAKKPAKKTVLSPEARQRVADAMKKRWADNQKKAGAKAKPIDGKSAAAGEVAEEEE